MGKLKEGTKARRHAGTKWGGWDAATRDTGPYADSTLVRRKLFTIFSAVSFVLCMLSLAAWVSSYWYNCKAGVAYDWRESASYRRVSPHVEGGLGAWCVLLDWGVIDPLMAPPDGGARERIAQWVQTRAIGFQGWAEMSSRTGKDRRWGWNDLWFSGQLDCGPNNTGYCMVQVPAWFPTLLLLAGPLLWVQRARREWQIRWEGLCAVCGYDLRASKDRCPECGTAIGPSSSSSTPTAG